MGKNRVENLKWIWAVLLIMTACGVGQNRFTPSESTGRMPDRKSLILPEVQFDPGLLPGEWQTGCHRDPFHGLPMVNRLELTASGDFTIVSEGFLDPNCDAPTAVYSFEWKGKWSLIARRGFSTLASEMRGTYLEQKFADQATREGRCSESRDGLNPIRYEVGKTYDLSHTDCLLADPDKDYAVVRVSENEMILRRHYLDGREWRSIDQTLVR